MHQGTIWASRSELALYGGVPNSRGNQIRFYRILSSCLLQTRTGFLIGLTCIWIVPITLTSFPAPVDEKLQLMKDGSVWMFSGCGCSQVSAFC